MVARGLRQPTDVRGLKPSDFAFRYNRSRALENRAVGTADCGWPW